MIIETERLQLRQMNQADYPDLCEILQDEEVMYAYDRKFEDADVQAWLDRQNARYQEYGFGLWDHNKSQLKMRCLVEQVLLPYTV
ncbi:GNAT family N-acetyltransferase [Paenibacillus sp. MER 180]|uniref:GNAT family N-acetyltransferase n=1 Tax=Paenibacillus sp. MER 180 TaxID=2939570 RepID=UPI0020407B31|nr:GNAT family N-acetyltransferase [Paenibacillus sp. MER 180]MCM3290615.1 GNAT family N-acetyltransferase [Paenibacillus sp. MER 180]